MFANSETEKLVGKVVLLTSQQHLHVLPELDVLETGVCLFYSPFRGCRFWVLHLNWIQKETGLHVQLLACILLQIEQSSVEHVVLDLTSLAHQPKSRERSARPTKHETFAPSQRKSAHPARAQELEDDEDDKPLGRPDRTTVSAEEDEDDKPLVQPASREKAPKRESSAVRRVPTPLRRRKGLPFWRDPSATLEQDVPGNSRERSEDVSSLVKISDGEALQQITNRMSDVRNLKDLHLKHYHMSS